METLDLRKELHQYIDESDDKFIKIFYELLKEFRQEGHPISEEEVKDFEERRERIMEYKRWRLIMDEHEQHLKKAKQSPDKKRTL